MLAAADALDAPEENPPPPPPPPFGFSIAGALLSFVSAFFNFFPAWIAARRSLDAI